MGTRNPRKAVRCSPAFVVCCRPGIDATSSKSALLLGIIALMHVVGFATLIFVIAPHHYRAGTQIFGVGLGATAYLFGLRHAFDADHIAAIDNTTRKLMTDGQRPKGRRILVRDGSFQFGAGDGGARHGRRARGRHIGR